MQDKHIIVTEEHMSSIESFNEKSKFIKMFNKSDTVDIPLEIKG